MRFIRRRLALSSPLELQSMVFFRFRGTGRWWMADGRDGLIEIQGGQVTPNTLTLINYCYYYPVTLSLSLSLSTAHCPPTQLPLLGSMIQLLSATAS